MSKVKTYKGHAVPDGAEKFLDLSRFKVGRHEFYKVVKGRIWYFDYDDKVWAKATMKENYNNAIELPEEEDNQEATQRSSQPHYKDDKDGLDHIARFARDNSIEEFRAAMRFTIDKYRDRLGEKDARSKELAKIADYYGRWAEVELELESKTDGC